MGTFRQNIAIDLGSSNIKIAVEKKGILVNEPSCITIKAENGEIVAIGKKSKEMIGKTDSDTITVKPIKQGVISEYTVAVNMAGILMDKAIRNPLRRLIRPDVITALHCNVTNVSKRAAERALKEAGAGRIFFVDAPYAAAIGAKLDVSAPNGKMVVNIGSEITDIAVLSYNGIVAGTSVLVGGSSFDEAIKNYFKKEYRMLLGDNAAEKIKINNACAYRDVRVEPFEVSAIELSERMPVEKTVKPDELIRPIDDAAMPIMDGIRSVLENTPPELAADIFERGILLTGGGALMAGLDVLISRATGIDVRVADKPENAIALGAIKILNNMSSDQKN